MTHIHYPQIKWKKQSKSQKIHAEKCRRGIVYDDVIDKFPEKEVTLAIIILDELYADEDSNLWHTDASDCNKKVEMFLVDISKSDDYPSHVNEIPVICRSMNDCKVECNF